MQEAQKKEIAEAYATFKAAPYPKQMHMKALSVLSIASMRRETPDAKPVTDPICFDLLRGALRLEGLALYCGVAEALEAIIKAAEAESLSNEQVLSLIKHLGLTLVERIEAADVVQQHVRNLARVYAESIGMEIVPPPEGA